MNAIPKPKQNFYSVDRTESANHNFKCNRCSRPGFLIIKLRTQLPSSRARKTLRSSAIPKIQC